MVALISALLITATIMSISASSITTSIFGVIVLLFSVSFSIYTIFQTHKRTPNARIKTAKDILIFLVTFLLILFIGGLAGILANFYISQQFGAVMGFVCAMLVSFAVGYGVRTGFAKFGL